jgi:hypothetical protein
MLPVPDERPEHSPDPGQISTPIRCPKCEATGVATWEKNRHAAQHDLEPTLVYLSPEFFERVARKSPYDIELVCKKCDTIQSE